MGLGIAQPTARLMSRLGLLLRAKSLHAKAERLYSRALAITGASFGPYHPTITV